MSKNKSAIKARIDVAGVELQPTYNFFGRNMTLDEMLAVQAKCGQSRFVLMDKSRGEPEGTLVDKLNPVMPVLSLEAQQEAFEARRRREGHGKIHQPTSFVVHPRVKGT